MLASIAIMFSVALAQGVGTAECEADHELTIDDATKSADSILLGRVLEVELQPVPPGLSAAAVEEWYVQYPLRWLTIAVERTWKGPRAKEVRVQTFGYGPNSAPFRKDGQAIIFAYVRGDHYITSCGFPNQAVADTTHLPPGLSQAEWYNEP